MALKIGSFIAYVIAVLGIVFLFFRHTIFSDNPVAISIQAGAVALMIWARITFGFRSFHALANTTQGGLVTNGPYHFLRHPVYASVIYFCWATLISFPLAETLAAVLVVTGGLFARMVLEEKFLYAAYDGYAAYAAKTKRIIPYLF